MKQHSDLKFLMPCWKTLTYEKGSSGYLPLILPRLEPRPYWSFHHLLLSDLQRWSSVRVTKSEGKGALGGFRGHISHFDRKYYVVSIHCNQSRGNCSSDNYDIQLPFDASTKFCVLINILVQIHLNRPFPEGWSKSGVRDCSGELPLFVFDFSLAVFPVKI